MGLVPNGLASPLVMPESRHLTNQATFSINVRTKKLVWLSIIWPSRWVIFFWKKCGRHLCLEFHKQLLQLFEVNQTKLTSEQRKGLSNWFYYCACMSNQWFKDKIHFPCKVSGILAVTGAFMWGKQTWCFVQGEYLNVKMGKWPSPSAMEKIVFCYFVSEMYYSLCL